jgi:polysaccharide biosynthesis transport protein
MVFKMQSGFSRYIVLAKRWAWVVILGVLICGGATYVVSKFRPPVYQATSYLLVSLCTAQTTPYECTSGSVAALPTYAQLIESPSVLNPVVANHQGLTLDRLVAMITVKPQDNTQLIEVAVQNTNPQLAIQLANEVDRSFFQFASSQLTGGNVGILPAHLETDPVGPKPLVYAGIGALVGLALAIALIAIFEWLDDRLTSPEEVQETVGVDTLAIMPQLSRRQRNKGAIEIPALAEAYRILCARLNAQQAIKPFRLVLVTSALAGEGKSTTAANLATFLAMTGKRVLLVDADLRHPRLHEHFQLDNRRGLMGAFMEMAERLEVKLDGQPTEIPTLRVLTAGLVPSNPTELLQSSLAHRIFDQFKKASQFDYVIFDTPPLLPVADVQIMTSYIQALVLVIDASRTPRKVLLRAKRLLNSLRTMPMGVVINRSPWPDYGDIRQYLYGTRQPTIDFDDMMLLHETSSGNGADMTVVLPQRQKDRDDKS